MRWTAISIVVFLFMLALVARNGATLPPAWAYTMAFILSLPVVTILRVVTARPPAGEHD